MLLAELKTLSVLDLDPSLAVLAAQTTLPVLRTDRLQ